MMVQGGVVMVEKEHIYSAIEKVKKQYKIKKAVLFGSYASGTATEESDIDLIVEFDEEAVSLFDLAALKFELEDILGKKVDVIHGPLQKDDMITVQEAVTLYG